MPCGVDVDQNPNHQPPPANAKKKKKKKKGGYVKVVKFVPTEEGFFKEGGVADDAVVFTGGSNWSLAWSPLVQRDEVKRGQAKAKGSGAGAHTLYLAVGPHPSARKLNRVNELHSGFGLIQIVRVRCDGPGKRIAEARVSYTVAHDGAVTWGLTWCPEALLEALRRAGKVAEDHPGLLAACLGNGDVCIYACPGHAAVHSRHADPAADSGGVPALDMKPVAKSEALRRRKAVPSCVAWCRRDPFDLLVVGCWDGSVGVLKCQVGKGGEAEGNENSPESSSPAAHLSLLSFYLADLQPITCITWLETFALDGSLRGESFATAGHSGTFKVWNARQPQALLLQRNIYSHKYITGLVECPHPEGFLISTSDGFISFIRKTSDGYGVSSGQMANNCLYSIDINDAFFAVTTMTGEVRVGHIMQTLHERVCFKSKYIAFQRCVASVSLGEDKVLEVEGTLPTMTEKKEDYHSPHQVHCFKTAWMPPMPGCDNLMGIAHGYGSGLVQLQLLERETCVKYMCNMRKLR
mmetsp:Transcript_30772/g.65997  ORF Transcript_30772/g.65997 Transcript_30772/m.65997 type:complete len:521 (-) Transcript_30772:76-1638(-)